LKPLSLEGTANYGDLLNLNVSPDGKWVAATRGRFDDSAVQRTIVGLKTIVRDPLSGVEQHIRPPARSPGDIGPGRWSPDGRYFAYELVRGGRVVVAVWDSRTKASTEPGKLLLRPDEPEFPAYNPVWSPDSHFVLAREWARSTPIDNRTALPRALASYDFNFPKGPAPSVVTFRSSPGETDNATAVTTFLPANSYVHLTLLDVKTGGKVRLSDEAFVAGASFSPEGRYVEYATYEKFDGATSAQLFDIHLFDMAHRTSVVVAHDVRLGNPDVSWSPDGRKFAYVARTVYGGSHPGGDREDGVIVVTDVPDGATHKFLAPQGSFRRRGGLQAAPVWLRSGTICDVSDRGEVWKIDLDSGQATRIGVPNGYTVRSLLAPPKTGASEGVLILAVDAARHRSGIFQDRGQPEAAFVSGSKGLLWDAVAGGAGDRAIVAFEHQAADDPGTVLALDLSDNSVKPVEENGRALGDLRFGPVQVLSWTGADQQTHKAALMLPPDFRQGRRVPLVVWD
jgi:dipeptidyl aminopeptidase/acylaminoacyl peptidase